MGKRITGVVRCFDNSRGYGTITAEGQDVFVHYSVISGSSRQNLLEGGQVECVVEESFRGPQAVEVVRLS